jgi:hypothetical protein
MLDFEPARAVTSVVANFSNIAERSSDLICGAEVEVVIADDEVDECDPSSEEVSDEFDPANTNLAAS